MLIFCVAGVSHAQKLLPFSPSVQIMLKGGYSTPLSGGTYTNGIDNGGTFQDYFKAFPGGELEAVINFTSSFGVYGNVSYDILTPKGRKGSLPGESFVEERAHQFSGYVGPRYYFDIPLLPISIYTDAGIGLYSLKYGDFNVTHITNPPSSDKYSYSSVSQLGLSAGAGVNITTSPLSFINFSIKYHNLMAKSGVTFVETHTQTINGVATSTQTSSVYDVDSRGYVQFSLGFGFKLGM